MAGQERRGVNMPPGNEFESPGVTFAYVGTTNGEFGIHQKRVEIPVLTAKDRQRSPSPTRSGSPRKAVTTGGVHLDPSFSGEEEEQGQRGSAGGPGSRAVPIVMPSPRTPRHHPVPGHPRPGVRDGVDADVAAVGDDERRGGGQGGAGGVGIPGRVVSGPAPAVLSADALPSNLHKPFTRWNGPIRAKGKGGQQLRHMPWRADHLKDQVARAKEVRDAAAMEKALADSREENLDWRVHFSRSSGTAGGESGGGDTNSDDGVGNGGGSGDGGDGGDGDGDDSIQWAGVDDPEGDDALADAVYREKYAERARELGLIGDGFESDDELNVVADNETRRLIASLHRTNIERAASAQVRGRRRSSPSPPPRGQRADAGRRSPSTPGLGGRSAKRAADARGGDLAVAGSVTERQVRRGDPSPSPPPRRGRGRGNPRRTLHRPGGVRTSAPEVCEIAPETEVAVHAWPNRGVFRGGSKSRPGTAAALRESLRRKLPGSGGSRLWNAPEVTATDLKMEAGGVPSSSSTAGTPRKAGPAEGRPARVPPSPPASVSRWNPDGIQRGRAGATPRRVTKSEAGDGGGEPFIATHRSMRGVVIRRAPKPVPAEDAHYYFRESRGMDPSGPPGVAVPPPAEKGAPPKAVRPAMSVHGRPAPLLISAEEMHAIEAAANEAAPFSESPAPPGTRARDDGNIIRPSPRHRHREETDEAQSSQESRASLQKSGTGATSPSASLSSGPDPPALDAAAEVAEDEKRKKKGKKRKNRKSRKKNGGTSGKHGGAGASAGPGPPASPADRPETAPAARVMYHVLNPRPNVHPPWTRGPKSAGARRPKVEEYTIPATFLHGAGLGPRARAALERSMAAAAAQVLPPQYGPAPQPGDVLRHRPNQARDDDTHGDGPRSDGGGAEFSAWHDFRERHLATRREASARAAENAHFDAVAREMEGGDHGVDLSYRDEDTASTVSFDPSFGAFAPRGRGDGAGQGKARERGGGAPEEQGKKTVGGYHSTAYNVSLRDWREMRAAFAYDADADTGRGSTSSPAAAASGAATATAAAAAAAATAEPSHGPVPAAVRGTTPKHRRAKVVDVSASAAEVRSREVAETGDAAQIHGRVKFYLSRAGVRDAAKLTEDGLPDYLEWQGRILQGQGLDIDAETMRLLKIGHGTREDADSDPERRGAHAMRLREAQERQQSGRAGGDGAVGSSDEKARLAAAAVLDANEDDIMSRFVPLGPRQNLDDAAERAERELREERRQVLRDHRLRARGIKPKPRETAASGGTRNGHGASSDREFAPGDLLDDIYATAGSSTIAAAPPTDAEGNVGTEAVSKARPQMRVTRRGSIATAAEDAAAEKRRAAREHRNQVRRRREMREREAVNQATRMAARRRSIVASMAGIDNHKAGLPGMPGRKDGGTPGHRGGGAQEQQGRRSRRASLVAALGDPRAMLENVVRDEPFLQFLEYKRTRDENERLSVLLKPLKRGDASPHQSRARPYGV